MLEHTTNGAEPQVVTSGSGVVDAGQWFWRMVERARNSPHGVVSDVVHLTPEIARFLLSRNPSNRPIARATVEGYASDIMAGEWLLNGQPIIISDEGLLNDGQNRCTAVVETGLAIPVIAVFGVSRISRRTIDQGKTRKLSDIIAMDAGGAEPTVAAQASNMLLAHRRGWKGTISARNGFTNAAGLAEYHRFRPEIDAAIGFCAEHAGDSRVVGGMAAPVAMYVLARRENAEGADEFIAKCIRGHDLPEGDPILVLRERLVRDGRLNPREKFALYQKTWAAWRDGRSVVRLRLPSRKRA